MTSHVPPYMAVTYVVWASWRLKPTVTRLFFFNSLFRLTTKKIAKFRVTVYLWLKSIGSKEQYCGEYFHVKMSPYTSIPSLQWRHNGRDSVSNHQPHDCLLNRLFRRRLKKTSKLRVTGLCVGNPPGTGEFPAQMASNAKNVSIWWRHHDGCFSEEIIFFE